MATRAQSEQQGATSLDTLDAEITAQNDVLNKLRLSGAPSEEVDRAKKRQGKGKRSGGGGEIVVENCQGGLLELVRILG